MEGVQRSLGRGRPFSYSLVRAEGAAVPDVFQSGGVRENKLSLPPGDGGQSRAAVGKIFLMQGGSGVGGGFQECESASSAGTKLSYYLL